MGGVRTASSCWVSLPPLPQPADGGAHALVLTRHRADLWVVGGAAPLGNSLSGAGLRHVQLLDLLRLKWHVLPELPEAVRLSLIHI